MFHPTVKYTPEYSKEEVNFLDLDMKVIYGKPKTDLFFKPIDTHQFLDPVFPILTIAKIEYLKAKL